MSDEQNHTTMPIPASARPGAADNNAAPVTVDLRWVWLEVRKRVFIKLPFSLGVADAMEAVVPITIDEDNFVCGLAQKDYPLSSHLTADQVRNTIENILRQAGGKPIHFEIIEGVTIDDWNEVKERRRKAQEAVIAISQQQLEAHHFEDVLNQIVGEIRQRITATRDRALPQVRAQMMLDVVPSLADAEEMLFPDPDSHDARRAMARVIDRVANFLEVLPVTLAIEVERYRREQYSHIKHQKAPEPGAKPAASPDAAEPPAEEATS
jgi:hypothetical protein